MKNPKKIWAILLSAAMAFVVCVIPAGAETIFDTAKAITSGKKVSTEIEKGESADYKITVGESGTLSIKFTDSVGKLYLYVMDSDGSIIECDSRNVTSGDYNSSLGYQVNSGTGICSATADYKVSKGTYYIRFLPYSGYFGSYSGSLSFTVTIPGGSTVTSVNNTSASSARIAIYIDEGDKLQLGAVVSGSVASSVEWSSSNSKIVKVTSKGRITGVSAGTAVVTAKSGSSSVSIVVIVED